MSEESAVRAEFEEWFAKKYGKFATQHNNNREWMAFEAGRQSQAESKGNCPTCDSPKPELHPSMQPDGGEVQICRNPWHAPANVQDWTREAAKAIDDLYVDGQLCIENIMTVLMDEAPAAPERPTRTEFIDRAQNLIGLLRSCIESRESLNDAEKAAVNQWMKEWLELRAVESQAGEREAPKLRNSCNRHGDCAAADVKAKAAGATFGASHCHDECCEDCFWC